MGEEEKGLDSIKAGRSCGAKWRDQYGPFSVQGALAGLAHQIAAAGQNQKVGMGMVPHLCSPVVRITDTTCSAT